MTIQIKYKTISKWLLLMLMISVIVIIYLWGMVIDRDVDRASITNLKKELALRDARIEGLEKERGVYILKVNESEKRQEAINIRYNELKKEYGLKTRLDKNKQAHERFNGKNKQLIVKDDMVCFDSTGIDSINNISIEHDRLALLVPEKDTTIANQKNIIETDSLVKEDLKAKFDRAEKVAYEQKEEADYQKRGKKFFMGLSAGLAVFQAVIIYVAVAR
jgi:hypothetical protein